MVLYPDTIPNAYQYIDTTLPSGERTYPYECSVYFQTHINTSPLYNAIQNMTRQNPENVHN